MFTPKDVLLGVASLAVIAACAEPERSTGTTRTGANPVFESFANSEWSEPVNLGPPVNVPKVVDGNPSISRDGLSLYFDSDRTDVGSLGARDLFVSRRDCVDCPWQTPVNLGANINTKYVDGGASVSNDGHFLFWVSHTTHEDCQIDPNRPPGDATRPCDEDIYASARTNPNDDTGWGPAVRLGPDVNTPFSENEPEYQQNAEDGRANLYFNRSLVKGSPSGQQIYYAAIKRRGVGATETVVETLGPAVLASELNKLNVLDGGVTVRTDGKELFFHSAMARPGGVGALDLWVSTRRNIHEPWSEPVNPGVPLNSRFADLSPSLSHDGRTLYFTSARQGLPDWDIWMATRRARKR